MTVRLSEFATGRFRSHLGRVRLGSIRNKPENNCSNASTVFPRINAVAFIKFFMIWVRRLFEGGVYSRAAFI